MKLHPDFETNKMIFFNGKTLTLNKILDDPVDLK